MSEFFASIKAFIEKGNIIIFLLAVAVAIFTYKVLSSEMLWAIFSFCVAYALFYGINILYNRYWTLRALEGEEKRRIESEKLAKEQETIKVCLAKTEQALISSIVSLVNCFSFPV